MSGELDHAVEVANAAFYVGSAFYWTRFVDNADELFVRFQSVLERYPSRILAPTHGNVVNQVESVTAVMKGSHIVAYRGGGLA